MKVTWKDFVKTSASEIESVPTVVFSDDGKRFKLGPGGTISHAVSKYNSMHPEGKITSDGVISANGGIPASRYRANRFYSLPSPKSESNTLAPQGPARTDFPLKSNNPGNVRNFGQKWYGRVTDPKQKGGFDVFGDPYSGLRAPARILYNWMQKDPSLTLESAASKYAPNTENDTEKYIRDLVGQTGVLKNLALSGLDDKTMAKILKAFIRNESGKKVSDWYTDDDYMRMWTSAKKSM